MKNASIKSLPQLVWKNILLMSAADKVYRNSPTTGALAKTPWGLRGQDSLPLFFLLRVLGRADKKSPGTFSLKFLR